MSGAASQTPMTLAEAAQCCGNGGPYGVCQDCPLLIEPDTASSSQPDEHPEVMRAAARAL